MAQTKKIVFLAGTKSHGPGDHEYDRGLTLLSRCLPPSVHAEVHPYGWPEDERTLDDADAIVLYADGSDHNEKDHPLLIGDRLATLKRQMERGCGFVTLHYATFAPVKRGGPEYLDWVGGFFDYETGPGANHWASAIQHWSSQAIPVAGHPITAGAAPFAVTEEWYYKMRLSPQHIPLLQVTPPGESSPQTVAWALERPGGGRGFACTGGHRHANWKLDAYRNLIVKGILWAAHAPLSPTPPPPDADAIRALILTGKHHPAHDWKQTTPALTEILQRDGRGVVTVWTDPEKLAQAELSAFDLIVQNYCNWESPTLSAASREKLLGFVRDGGGLLLVHFANGAWRDWPEYFGGLARRVWVDGKANHDAYGPFTVRVTSPRHRLTEGLTDFDTMDELYCSQVGERPVEPLLTARSKVTNRDEPLAFAYSEGKGRIVQTLLGHDAGAVRTPAHAEFLRRAAAWVSRREVLPMPVIVPQVKKVPAPAGVLDARAGGKQAKGDVRWLEAPLTVTCRAQLFSKGQYNILVASGHKDSKRHWELYTEAGSGRLAVYVPGASPTNLVASVDVCDGQWHTLQLDYLPGSLRLTVDGKRAGECQIGMAHDTAPIGPLWLGCYPPQSLGCDGFLDDIQLTSQGKTLAAFHFEGDEGLKPAESIPAPSTAWSVDTSARWPTVDPKTSVGWVETGNDPGRTRYSSLTQINKKNVKGLKPAWTFHTGDAGNGTTIECTPIVVDGVMYLTTVQLRIIALDAATGKALWVHDPKAGGVNRGVTYWSDGKASRILCGLPDGRLISLDAKTGKLDPKFGKGGTVFLREGYPRDLKGLNYGCTSALSLFENLVIVPIINSEGQPGAPGDIRAFDVRTGKEVWRFHTVPEPGEFGNDTWAKDSWKERSGTNAWAGYTVDVKNAMVFAATGSAASDFYGADRHGKNLFANCLIALEARTGKRLWHFQTVHHDLWDHDNPCPPVLCTVKGKEAVALPTKTGFIYVFERKSGKSFFPIEERAAPPSPIPGEKAWPTQPYPTAPPPLEAQKITLNDLTTRTPEAANEIRRRLKQQGILLGKWRVPGSRNGSIIAPGLVGGANWSGASFDPETGKLFINTTNKPFIIQLEKGPGDGYRTRHYPQPLLDKDGYPGVQPPWGHLTAVDLNKGTFAWRIPFGSYPELADKTTGSESFGGTIVTKGGLVFIGGSRDELFHAYDKDTGTLLWSHKLPAGGYATPATYQVNGKQFVVIAAGGGRNGKYTKEFVAFALPEVS